MEQQVTNQSTKHYKNEIRNYKLNLLTAEHLDNN